MIELNKIYKFFDVKYAPVFNFFGAWTNELINCLKNLNKKCGIMRDFHGYEYEEDNTITFYDFTGDSEKSINIELNDLIIILRPMIDDYLKINPNQSIEIENLIDEIQNS